MREVFKDIIGYKNKYQISNLGRVRSPQKDVGYRYGGKRTLRPRLLKLCGSTRGGKQICLCVEGNRRVYRIHNLVLKHFDRERKFNELAFFYDGNMDKPILNNMEWKKSNTAFNGWNRDGYKSLLTKKNGIEICSSYKKGNITMTALGEKFGCTYNTISKALKLRYNYTR